MNPDANVAAVVTLGDYIEVFVRRKWLIAGATIVGAILALFITLLQTPTYTAEAHLLIQPPLQDVLEGSQRVDQLINMRSETEIASSIAVADLASARLGGVASARQLQSQLEIIAVPDSQVLQFRYVDPSPEFAQQAANAVSLAYLDWKRQQTDTAAIAVVERLESQMAAIEADIAEKSNQMSILIQDSPEFRAAQIERELLASELTFLRRQVAAASRLSTDPGMVIEEASLPAGASSPNRGLNVLIGLLLGGMIGVALAFFRHRTDDRLMQRKDSLELLGMRVLGTVPRPEGGSLVRVGGDEAEAHRRLSGNVMFLAESQGAKVVLVTSPNLGPVTSSIAGHLATSAARVGKRVLIVSGNLRNSNLHTLFGVESTAGLVGVLIGEIGIDHAVRENPRFQRLQVLPAGRPVAQPAELLQTEAFRYHVNAQREKYDLIIIEGPPVNEFADSLAIAPHVDGVVLIAADGQTTKTDLQYATGQLQRNGAEILGAVMMSTPKQARRRPGQSGSDTPGEGVVQAAAPMTAPMPAAAPVQPMAAPVQPAPGQVAQQIPAQAPAAGTPASPLQHVQGAPQQVPAQLAQVQPLHPHLPQQPVTAVVDQAAEGL